MSKAVEISGCIEIPDATDKNDVIDKFIGFVESNGWTFGGGFKTIVNDWYIDENGNRIKHISDE